MKKWKWIVSVVILQLICSAICSLLSLLFLLSPPSVSVEEIIAGTAVAGIIVGAAITLQIIYISFYRGPSVAKIKMMLIGKIVLRLVIPTVIGLAFVTAVMLYGRLSGHGTIYIDRAVNVFIFGGSAGAVVGGLLMIRKKMRQKQK